MRHSAAGAARSVATAVGALFLGIATALPAGASGVLDLRGTWVGESHVGSAVYPQDWHITEENLATGAFSGTDVGTGSSAGVTLSMTGSVSGSTFHLVASGGGYSSNSTGTITSVNGHLVARGTFQDSHGVSGTWLETRAAPGGGTGRSPSVSATNLLVNGDLAAPPLASGALAEPAGGSRAITGWTVGGANVDLIGPGYWQSPPGAVQSVDLAGVAPGSITQRVATVPGQTYLLRFELAGNPAGPPLTKRVDVTWDGRVVASLVFDESGHSASSMGWRSESVRLVATSTSSTLTFSDASGVSSFGPVVGGLVLVADTGAGSGTAPFGAGGVMGDQSSIASTLASPSQAFSSLGHDLAVLAVAGAATLFITFPAQLFNHTFEENYDEIVGFFARLRPRRRPRLAPEDQGVEPDPVSAAGGTGAPATDAAPSHPATTGDARNRTRLALVVTVGALLGGLLDPTFGFNARALETFIAIVATTVWGVTLARLVATRYRRATSHATAFAYSALPGGLAIAGACVVVSRATGLEPGYLYGIVAGVAFTEAVTEHEEAHVATLSVLATLVGAVVAWFIWSAVNPSATHAGGDFPLVIFDDFLAAVFAGGLTGSVIGLLPLRFLPGGRIVAWHRGAWGATFLAATFGLVGVVLWPHRGGHHGSAPIVTVILAFAVFGGLSVATWWFFERRKRRAAAADDEPPTSGARGGPDPVPEGA